MYKKRKNKDVLEATLSGSNLSGNNDSLVQIWFHIFYAFGWFDISREELVASPCILRLSLSLSLAKWSFSFAPARYFTGRTRGRGLKGVEMCHPNRLVVMAREINSHNVALTCCALFSS